MKSILQLYRIGLGLVLLLLAACSDDKGNYDYRQLVEPDISGVPDELSVLVYDNLTLNPDLGSQARPEKYYDFEWKAINRNEDTEVTVIGNTRQLDYTVELKPGIYTLYFTVTERSSGLYWQQHCTLTVSDTTTEGWMILCSDNGRARLDMISATTGKTYRDVLQNNGMPALHGPRKIQWLSKQTDEESPFYLFTDEGATRLGQNGFEWKEEYLLQYEVATLTPLTPYQLTVAGFGKMMVSGSNAYYSETLSIPGLYGSPVNKGFRVAPAIGANTSALIYVAVYLMYDTDNKCFMAYCPMMRSEAFGAQEPLQTMEGMEAIATSMKGEAGVVGHAFDRYPTGYDYVYMENTNYDPGNGKMGRTYTILADGDKRYLYGIQLGDLLLYADCTYIIGRSYFGDLSGCKDITREDNLYAFSSLRNYMYYAVGNTVYRVDLSSQPLKAEKQFTLSGETITCLKFNLYQKSENAMRSFDLIVGSTRNRSGVLRIYDGMATEGDFSAVEPVVYTGFAPIVDATYRERN